MILPTYDFEANSSRAAGVHKGTGRASGIAFKRAHPLYSARLSYDRRLGLVHFISHTKTYDNGRTTGELTQTTALCAKTLLQSLCISSQRRRARKPQTKRGGARIRGMSLVSTEFVHLAGSSRIPWVSAVVFCAALPNQGTIFAYLGRRPSVSRDADGFAWKNHT